MDGLHLRARSRDYPDRYRECLHFRARYIDCLHLRARYRECIHLIAKYTDYPHTHIDIEGLPTPQSRPLRSRYRD